MPRSPEQQAKARERARQYRRDHPDKVAAYQKRYRENNAEKIRAYHQEWNEKNRGSTEFKEAAAKYRRSYYEKTRSEALDAYGGSCVCCGESEKRFLCLDHVNDDGHLHRKTIGPGRMHRWAKRNGYPPTLQILCHNCNHAKRFGVCPHQRKRGVKVPRLLLESLRVS